MYNFLCRFSAISLFRRVKKHDITSNMKRVDDDDDENTFVVIAFYLSHVVIQNRNHTSHTHLPIDIYIYLYI